MKDVPVEYLHWLWLDCGLCYQWDRSPVASYIEANLDALKEENPDLTWE